MIWSLLLFHIAACVVLAAVRDRVGRGVFAIVAAPMATTATWAIVELVRGNTTATSFTWVGNLDLTIAFRGDAFSLVLVTLVSGIGALVALYSAGYFGAGTVGVGRFAATLLAFSTAMVGLVLADTVWTMFLFWEMTSITSFLLVGHKRTDATTRTAARRALVITAGGGLCLLGGFVLLLDASPGDRISTLEPVSGGLATAAAVLLMIAAATKSAQVPFHVWLPGAMAAPTPVSAYLHSATMVKAGVVLVAVASPAFTEVAVWTPLGITLGGITMLWGAIGALRQLDAKLILAWGTVSQLGLMVLLLSLGSAKATFAALAIVVAHAIFKAALFMVVGEIDVRTGTRDVNQLQGLWRTMPVGFGVAVVSAASMAGIPPMLGFPAKEAAVEAALGLYGFERSAVLALVVGGSVLTVAYTTRFVLATFGGRGTPTQIAPARRLLAAPSIVLGVLSVVGFAALGTVTDLVRDASVTINADAVVYSLLRWPGLTDAFLISVGIVTAGGVLGVLIVRLVDRAAPRTVGADAADSFVDGMIATARRVAGRVQHGSLPAYLLTIGLTASLAVIPFVGSLSLDGVYRWDNAGQAGVSVAVVAGAIAATVVRSRLGAALVLGAVGFAVTGAFVAHGAPDLVLTQLLVETVIVVGFVVGLGRLGTRFPKVGGLWLTTRISVSLAAASAVALALVASASNSVGNAPTEQLIAAAVDEGGGKNVVNVILTDVRALDTMGEIIVLVAVAIGILSLTRRARSDDKAATS